MYWITLVKVEGHFCLPLVLVKQLLLWASIFSCLLCAVESSPHPVQPPQAKLITYQRPRKLKLCCCIRAQNSAADWAGRLAQRDLICHVHYCVSGHKDMQRMNFNCRCDDDKQIVMRCMGRWFNGFPPIIFTIKALLLFDSKPFEVVSVLREHLLVQ